jgi:hypothetical protein
MCDISLADTTAIMSTGFGACSRKGQLRVAVLVSGLFLFNGELTDISMVRRNAKTTALHRVKRWFCPLKEFCGDR